MILLMEDHIVKKTIKIFCDILVRVVSFSFLVNFFILDCEFYFEASIILRRPFLDIGRVLVDMETEKLKF